MDLMESISANGTIRGITLNSQEIDLFNLLENENAIEEIYRYLTDILLASEMDTKRMAKEERVKKVVQERLNLADKDKFITFILENETKIRANWDSREKLQRLFEREQFDSVYIDGILEIKKYFIYQTHGILSFLVDKDGNTIPTDKFNYEEAKANINKEKTYEKVQALHEYVAGRLQNGEYRFNRLTLDSQGKFSTVASVITTEKEATAKPQDYNLEALREGYEFAKRHNMNEVYINALVFFKDFPERLVGEDKEKYRIALINYGKAVASIIKEYQKQGVHTAIDMFNEFVDYYEPFSERTNNWMSKLRVEDLCEIALIIKQEIPDVDFGYNDWNFENPNKRKAIFEVIRKIQTFERENNCKIIDHIGTQCHTSINDINRLRKAIEELQQFGLPIDVTELDISKKLDGVDYESATPEELGAIRKYEQKLQNEMMKMLRDFAIEGKIRCITSWSVTDELCCDFCDGKQASITGMRYDAETGFNFFGKDMDIEIEMTEQEMQLIRDHIKKVRENRMAQIEQNPIQDFCFHTHTQRCGHAEENVRDEDFVEQAIIGGIKKLAFTDHIPLPDGIQRKANVRMDIAEVQSYLESIHYLQETYKGQIEIESGFEFEYSDRDLEHLLSLKEKTDKMVLGQHFVIDSEGRENEIARGKIVSDRVLELYASSIITAMDKEIPDVIVHPDLFMQSREKFGTKEEEITRAICKKAAEKGIPLEINLGKIAQKAESKLPIDELKKSIPYPSPEFWEIVADETRIAKENGKDLIVIYGKDAHFSRQLSTETDYEIARQIIGDKTLGQLHIVTRYEDLELKKKTKSTQELGQETLEEQKDVELLDEVERVQTKQEKVTEKQR